MPGCLNLEIKKTHLVEIKNDKLVSELGQLCYGDQIRRFSTKPDCRFARGTVINKESNPYDVKIVFSEAGKTVYANFYQFSQSRPVHLDEYENYDEELRREMVEFVLKDVDPDGKIMDENTSLCVICMENPCNIIFGKCGHVCVCKKCFDSMLKRNGEKCPICPICRMKGNVFLMHYNRISHMKNMDCSICEYCGSQLYNTKKTLKRFCMDCQTERTFNKLHFA
jgi:hypothetical protein